ncbi:hypothetical protein ACO0LG_12090 [Undibacterium sp. Ji42W]|uniref:hypothetical protein n=1 Tax=Undibacterium sp. Ji42W TaxID=3413039 RepID=UPI003BF07DA3
MPASHSLRLILAATGICILFSGSRIMAQDMSSAFALTLEIQGVRFASHRVATPQSAQQEIKLKQLKQLKQQVILQKDGQFRTISESVWPGTIRFHFLTTGNKDGAAAVDLLPWRQGIEIERENAAEARNAYADLLFLSPALLLELDSMRMPINLPGAENQNCLPVNFNDATGRPASMIIKRNSGQVLRAKTATSTQTLFQGDLFYLPEVGPIPPVFDVGLELDSLITQHRLQVQQLVGVHGRSGTFTECKNALELRMTEKPSAEKT